MEPYLSELRIFAFSYAPRGWAQCNGQLLSIQQNQALFSLLGTTYGGNGVTTFGLPDLRGRTPMHIAASSGFPQGQSGGEQAHTLSLAEMPAHTHQAFASSNAPAASTPANNFWPSNPDFAPYAPAATVQMAAGALASAGGGQPHENMSPYLVVNICIATQGIYPSRN